MRIAVVTLDGFNELDSFAALTILGRVRRPDWTVSIASPTSQVTSMNGVRVAARMSLDELPAADAVIVGSGVKTREYAADDDFVATLQLDPTRQPISSQCSGVLLLARLGLFDGMPVCTDSTTKPWAIEAGLDVVDLPFLASREDRDRRRLPLEPVPRGLGHRTSGRCRHSSIIADREHVHCAAPPAKSVACKG